MAVIVGFAEQQHQNYFEDYEIYIFGQRVTPFVKGDVRITLVDRDGFNTATFDLDNALDRFILTPENLGISIADDGAIRKIDPVWRLTDEDYYSESIKKAILDWKTKEDNNPVDDTGVRQYPINIYGNVFTKNDPIRIAIHNPLTEDDQWFFRFTGFVDAKPEDEDYVMGSQTIRMQCYCMKALTQRQRINSVQVGVKGGPVVKEQLVNSKKAYTFFADLDKPTSFTHPLANKKFEQGMSDLIVGNTKEGWNGIGQFTRGVTVSFQTASYLKGDKRCTNLEDWYAICLFGVDKKFLTWAEINNIGRQTLPEGKYWPINCQMHILLPKGGTGANNLVEYEHAEGGSTSREWTSRYDAISDLCQRIDYQWWTSGMGDQIVEFPMYDFSPKDFGEFSSVMTIDQHAKKGTMDEDSGEVVTAIAVTGMPGFQNANGDKELPEGLKHRVVVGSTNLARRNGVNMQTLHLPFSSNYATLARLGKIEFQKRLSDANKVGVDFSFRPFLLPNKPLYHKTREVIGLTTAVTDSLTTYERADSNADMRYIRRRDIEGKFRFITGGESAPISYNSIYGDGKYGQPKSGVQSSINEAKE